MKRGGGLRRRTPLKAASVPLARSKGVRRANRPRKAEAFVRAYGSADRVAWFRAQPCLVCGALPSENAHVRSGGMGRKADARWIVPLCGVHHSAHHAGAKSFEAQYGVDLLAQAHIWDARWEAERAGGDNG